MLFLLFESFCYVNPTAKRSYNLHIQNKMIKIFKKKTFSFFI